MNPIRLHDRDEIEKFLRRNVFLHLYGLGDLDDFFWPHTRWYGLRGGGELRSIALLYKGISPPVLLALTGDDDGFLEELLRSLIETLPRRFYCHLSPPMEAVLGESFELTSHGLHYKTALREPELLSEVDTSAVTPLTMDDLDELLELYEASYPNHSFDPRMLLTKQYYAVRYDGRVISAGGVHVYSPRYRVAALGNICTHPDWRGQGCARAVTAKVCESLSATTDHIGLNVKVDNAPAIRCYRKLGFVTVAEYGEYTAQL